MAGIDRLAETMGREADLDPVERDNLMADAAEAISRLRAAIDAVADEWVGPEWTHERAVREIMFRGERRLIKASETGETK